MKAFQEFSFVWILVSILSLFAGIFLWTTAPFTGNDKIGLFLMTIGVVSFILFVTTSLFYFFTAKNASGLERLKDGYLILSLLFIVGGIIARLIHWDDTLQYLYIGLGMLAFYWIMILFKNIARAE